MTELVGFAVADGVARIRFNRPEKLNAFPPMQADHNSWPESRAGRVTPRVGSLCTIVFGQHVLLDQTG